jgi:ABC-2 type transport system ATP-binding protein
MTAVAVHNLHKSYSGKPAVRDLSFSVEPGEMLGLIGPNGAGKSSTIKMILDFMRPDAGQVELFGGPMTEATKDRIGYLPEEKGLYKKLPALDQILYLASLKGVPKAAADERAHELLRRTGMLESKKKKIKEMSKGMGQMIQLIVTLVHDPDLVLLDEPFSGLDPVNTELLKEIVAEQRDRGKAVILSTHQMNQVEAMCDRVLMINHGQAVLYGGMQEIRTQHRKKTLMVSVDGDLPDVPGVVEVRPARDAAELVLTPDTTPQQVLDRLRERGAAINRFEITTPTLHDIFIKLAGENNEQDLPDL